MGGPRSPWSPVRGRTSTSAVLSLVTYIACAAATCSFPSTRNLILACHDHESHVQHGRHNAIVGWGRTYHRQGFLMVRRGALGKSSVADCSVRLVRANPRGCKTCRGAREGRHGATSKTARSVATKIRGGEVAQRNTIGDAWWEAKAKVAAVNGVEIDKVVTSAESKGEAQHPDPKSTPHPTEGWGASLQPEGGGCEQGQQPQGDNNQGNVEVYLREGGLAAGNVGDLGGGPGDGGGDRVNVPPPLPPPIQGSLPSGMGAEGAGGKGSSWVVRLTPKYVTVKVLFFLFYSSLGAVMPYLPVYYHSLGISDRRIGHLGAITPAVTFLVSPLWGAVSDKTGHLKEILVFTFVASVVFRVALSAHQSFAWIVSIILLTSVVNAPVRPLLDSSVLNLLDDKKEYGKQRLWGQWGFGVGSFLTGRLMSRRGYNSAFMLHALFSLPTLLILFCFSPKKEPPKEPPKFREGLRVVAKDADVLVFFSMVFAIGLSSGVIENFAYKRLRELGSTGSVLGVSRLVSSLSGIPMFYYSGTLTKHMSVVGVLALSMLSYIIRFLIYASIKNPWAGLPAEALRGITFAAFWAASTYNAHEIAPEGMNTTMLGILNAVYGGIGQSLGALIGGSLSTRFGTAKAFVVYAGFDTLLLASFFLFWGLHPRGSKRSRAPPELSRSGETGMEEPRAGAGGVVVESRGGAGVFSGGGFRGNERGPLELVLSWLGAVLVGGLVV